MAFFMFITGFVMFHTYPKMQTLEDYAHYVKKKWGRLMPAYLLFAVAITAGKTILGPFMQVSNPVNGLQDLVQVLVCPQRSCCRSLWYIYVVCVYFLIVPPLLVLFRQQLKLLLILALGAYFLPRSMYFCQTRVCEYMFVFLLGGYALQRRALYLDLIDRYSWAFCTVFAGCIMLSFVVDIPKLLFGLASIPALHSLVRSRIAEKTPVLAVLGKYAFPIYLLNSVVIGGLQTALQTWWSLDGPNFCIVVPVLLASGLLVPIISYNLFIRRVPVLRTVIRA